ncbi:hypothetical protein [Streptomyces sp900116325]|uniref:hypothetical protein n=1 Tax=Streptomyces sp. 900116325 TaxID=3154295 RepID=UPI0033FD49DB
MSWDAVLMGQQAMRVLRASSDEIVAAYTFLRDVDAGLPFHGDYVYDDFAGRIVALDDHIWCLPVEPDMAIAPPERRANIEAHLAWIIDRRFAWPLHWGRFDIWPDAATAIAHFRTTSPDTKALRVGHRVDGWIGTSNAVRTCLNGMMSDGQLEEGDGDVVAFPTVPQVPEAVKPRCTLSHLPVGTQPDS